MIYSSYVDIGVTELPFLASFPVPFSIPVPGAGKILVPQSIAILYTQTPSIFVGGGEPVVVAYDGFGLTGWNTDILLTGELGGIFTASHPMIAYANDSVDPASLAGLSNIGLNITMRTDMGISGPIGTIVPAAPGAGYINGEYLVIDGGGPPPGVVQITSVDGGGGILSVSLFDGGASYSTGNYPASPGSGSGTGATFDVTVSAPGTGTARVYLYYSIVDVAP